MLCSKKLSPRCEQLSYQIALLAKTLSKRFVDPTPLQKLLACRLIPLDKQPQSEQLKIRPIGVGEILRKIIGKCLMMLFKPELTHAAGSFQTCAGQMGGAEASIHAMNHLYESEKCEAILFVDADNAFNSLNREASLLNMKHVCPEFQYYLVNTYRKPSRLYLQGKNQFILSHESCTQGDNTAMSM